MVTRDEVPHDRRLSGSITVTVEEVRTNPKPQRDAELTVQDEDGAELSVVIWETHEIEQNWKEGATYELTGVRGKRYSTESGSYVELNSTKAFSAKRVATNDVTRVLILGDTHVGYRHRPSSDKPAWAENVNARAVFIQCLERARELNVDAVVHAGDVFDHRNTQKDRKTVAQAISRTTDAGIPFYYVFGNHDDKGGRRLLESTTGTHLEVSQIGKLPVNFLGIDHSGQEFPREPPDASIELLLEKNVLVIHESPHPVIDATNSLLYQNDLNKANISQFIEDASFEIDLVVSGHLHVAEQPRIRGHDIPVLVTGPTVPISSYKKNSNPSTWLLTATDSGIDLERQSI